ncbi:hypothetical protein N0V82_003830 [Gnomoniopsis sp. IMI 355080]|nr:hypothetical protein N0V82_003830 [Gnomoniopsis sp. IMI 355080]
MISNVKHIDPSHLPKARPHVVPSHLSSVPSVPPPTMLGLTRRKNGWLLGAAGIATLYLMFLLNGNSPYSRIYMPPSHLKSKWQLPDDYFWKTVSVYYPPKSIRPLPTERPVPFPKVQASKFPKATPERDQHLEAIKTVFTKAWNSYKEKAWLYDELMPVSGKSKNPFGGWGATLVDSLDTLYIMSLFDEFEQAVKAAETIDFTKTNLGQINVFETTIRYLGGFLSAYDLSGDVRLLRKAVEVGELLYKAFDTPNRMPVTRWDMEAAGQGNKYLADENVLIAEIGSLTMEFTRLSILTEDPKWFDAVQQIADLMAEAQGKTELEGMWPMVVNGKQANFHEGTHFTLAAMADSAFEYLPKMSALLGGKIPQYQAMYEKAMDTASRYLLFRPLTPDNADILIAGSALTETENRKTTVTINHEGQHLTCYAGGMYGLGGRLFDRKADIDIATKLTEGCVWTYGAMQHGVMPETFHMAPCPDRDECEWDELAWKKRVVINAGETITGDYDTDMGTADRIIKQERLPQGFTKIGDRRYILRPEAIESVFVLYRITGREDLLDTAWKMFTAIDKMTSTTLANSAVNDVTVPGQPAASDSMESFWMGETLKYFYLIFSDERLVDLDEWVFNTEAHPFRRLKR